MEVSELLQQTHKLPNVPDVVRELIQQLNNPKADYSVIAAKVIHDQTLSLKILRLVNSAHFGLSRKISSINEAIIMLGMAQLKTMVIASGFTGSVKEVEGLDLKQFWAESFQIAELAKWFAEKSNNVDPDTAFTIQVIEGELPAELSEQYAAVGNTVLELHVANETGYGFALKPLLTIHYNQEELNEAQGQGATLDPLKGNLIVLYKEQRSPKWVAQTSVTVNEDANTVVVSNIAGAGAWRLVAKK